jgi:hypothetical protein
LGANPLVIVVGTPFSDPGAIAFDPEDGDITSRINISGSVNTSVLGSYTLTYSVTDTAGNAATPVTRTVNVVSGGGGGGGGGGGFTALVLSNETITSTANSGEVRITWNTNIPATSRVVYGITSITSLGSAPLYGYTNSNATDTTLVYNHSMTLSGLVPGVTYYFRPISTEGTQTAVGVELVLNPQTPTSCFYLKEYLRYGQPNNREEVLKLQSFLRDFEGFRNLEVTGFFDLSTDAAVRAFQDKYANDVLVPWNLPGNTGYVYYTTQKKINEIYCQRAFPLNDAQLAEIEAYKRLLRELERSSETSGAVLPVVGQSTNAAGALARDTSAAVGRKGRVAGAQTQEQQESSMTNGASRMTDIAKDNARSGVIEQGKIALADLLAIAPNLGEKFFGRSNSDATSTLSDITAINAEAATATGRFAAAIGYVKEVGSCTWSAWALFLVILILLGMYLRLWMRYRKASETEFSNS